MASNEASGQVVGNAMTLKGDQETSEVKIPADSIAFSIQKNKYGDELPMIPTSARVRGGKVLYRLKVDFTVTRAGSGAPSANRTLSFQSTVKDDKIVVSGPTNGQGQASFTLESWEPGKRDIKPVGNYEEKTLPLDFSEAWYESTFLITGYHVCAESDFSGELVSGKGLADKHKKDFLFSARGVPMQGTGQATNGRYVRLQSSNVSWHRNAAGHRDRVENSDSVAFAYADGVLGAFGEVTEGRSIAVDPKVIPKTAKVTIDGVGDRHADDRGSGISDYHIDNFLGAGHAVVRSWEQGGVNMTQRKVKYCGR